MFNFAELFKKFSKVQLQPDSCGFSFQVILKDRAEKIVFFLKACAGVLRFPGEPHSMIFCQSINQQVTNVVIQKDYALVGTPEAVCLLISTVN
jgi:hypothetical protein